MHFSKYFKIIILLNMFIESFPSFKQNLWFARYSILYITTKYTQINIYRNKNRIRVRNKICTQLNLQQAQYLFYSFFNFIFFHEIPYFTCHKFILGQQNYRIGSYKNKKIAQVSNQEVISPNPNKINNMQLT